jgi:hypothetical protein
VLDCHTPAGRALIRRRGVASVMSPPVIARLPVIAAGKLGRVSLPLPAGKWELSLQYTSAVNLELTAAGSRWRMPAYLDRPGPAFAVGTLTSSGSPVTIAVRADRPSSVTGRGLGAVPTALVAMRIPNIRVLVPLQRSCGRYVDWYRLF